MVKNKIRTLVICVFALIIFFPSLLSAQIGVNVYDETVYKYLDKLVSRKLVKTYNPYQRPLSRYAVAKMVIEARGRLNSEGDGFTSQILEELEEEFQKEISAIEEKNDGLVDFRPINKANLSWTATDQPEEPMPPNGLGPTSGTVQPLLAYKEGRHYNKYANFYFETEHWLEWTPYFSAYINPQFYYDSKAGDPDGGAKVHYGYLKAGYKNFEFQVGRDQIRWGSGEYGNLLFTNNARGLDMIRLTTPSTFRLPWVFKHLGQWRFTTFFSWLGTSYQLPNSILTGYRVDYMPLYWLDIGFDHVVSMGGKGAKDPNVKDAIGEYIGFIFDSGNSRATSNHQMGLDLSVKIPPLMGAEIYGKVLFEDTNKENSLMFKHNASYQGGLYFPRLDPAGRLSLRAEFVRTGEYAYRHSIYTSGYAVSDKFMGYDAGSDTYSGLLKADYIFNIDEFVNANFRYLKRSSNTYRGIYDPSGDQTGLAVNVAGTKEYHYMFKVGGQKKLSPRINLYGEVGIDYTRNKMFTLGKNDLDFSTQLMLIFHHL